MSEVQSLFVEGYADQLSYRAGDAARLCVSTTAEQYAVEISRLGEAREIVWQRDDLPGAEHPVPEDASAQGCGWPVSCEVEIPTEWRSGYYEVVFRAAKTKDGRWCAGNSGTIWTRPSPTRTYNRRLRVRRLRVRDGRRLAGGEGDLRHAAGLRDPVHGAGALASAR